MATSEAHLNDALALRLRLSGATYPDIAKQLGYAGPSGAHAAVDRELRRRLTEPADQLRAIELLRLDRMQAALWKVLTSPLALGLEIANGGDADDAENAAAALAKKVQFFELEKAIGRLLQISKRRADLMGLDAPKKVDITTQIRDMAIAEGLDPDQAVRDAEAFIRQLDTAGA